MKRFALVSLIVVIVAILIIAGIILRKREVREAGPNNNSRTPESQLPSSLPGLGNNISNKEDGLLPNNKIDILSSEPISDYFVYDEGHWVAVKTDGEIIEVQNGQLDTLSSAKIDDLISVSFSFDGKKVLALSGANGNFNSNLFDIETEAWESLPAEIKNAAWSPDNYRIAYFVPKNDEMALTVLDLGKFGAAPRELLRMSAKGLIPFWVNSSQIMLAEKSSALALNSLWSFDINSRTLSRIINESRGLLVNWNKEGNKGILYTNDPTGRIKSLNLINNKGSVLQKMSFITLPQKCVFGHQVITATSTSNENNTLEEFLYCALPRDVQKLNAATIPDDYFKKILITSDDFFRINLESGGVATIFADSDGGFDAEKLRVFGDKLFFINRADQKLYAISL